MTSSCLVSGLIVAAASVVLPDGYSSKALILSSMLLLSWVIFAAAGALSQYDARKERRALDLDGPH